MVEKVNYSTEQMQTDWDGQVPVIDTKMIHTYNVVVNLDGSIPCGSRFPSPCDHVGIPSISFSLFLRRTELKCSTSVLQGQTEVKGAGHMLYSHDIVYLVQSIHALLDTMRMSALKLGE